MNRPSRASWNPSAVALTFASMLAVGTLLAVCAAGRILNPKTARSQVIGAMTMGVWGGVPLSVRRRVYARTVSAILGNAGSINGTVKGIRGNLSTLAPVVRSINDGVATINGQADNVIRDVKNIKIDLQNVLTPVGGGGTGGHNGAGGKTISGHANSIDCSLAILNSQGCER